MECLGEEEESGPRAYQSEELDSNPCSAVYNCETLGESFNPQVIVLPSANTGAVTRISVWVNQVPSTGQGD